uniref:Coiled-coil domain-containing protein 86 n=1 Tax=Scleropages formosus TaxID=113540 RepID=A0A8D0CKN8_SCLFO
MSRRSQKAVLEPDAESVATRTRSGRIVGAAVALQLQQRPGRRARRRVVVVEARIDPDPEPEAEPDTPVGPAADPKPELEAEAKRRRREDGDGGCGGEEQTTGPAGPAKPQSSVAAGAEKENRAAADGGSSSSSGSSSINIPLGRPKSGRVWKDRNKQRFSALLRDKPLCTSWEKKMEAKREKELVKKYSQQLKDAKAREKEEKRKRREQNLRRREENERKAEIVQVVRTATHTHTHTHRGCPGFCWGCVAQCAVEYLLFTSLSMCLWGSAGGVMMLAELCSDIEWVEMSFKIGVLLWMENGTSISNTSPTPRVENGFRSVCSLLFSLCFCGFPPTVYGHVVLVTWWLKLSLAGVLVPHCPEMGWLLGWTV